MLIFLANPLGEVDISKIEFDPKSRDDIPQILKGLQYIYVNRPLRESIFKLLEKHILPNVNKGNGRPGMELWKIFVMGVLRLNLNWNYDALHEQVNNHKTIRQMLGHGIFDFKMEYQLQTVKDNVSLLTPELLDEINQVIVSSGHQLLKKRKQTIWRVVATHSLLRQMCIFLPISIYSLTRRAKSLA